MIYYYLTMDEKIKFINIKNKGNQPIITSLHVARRA
jgi:hypothetical protein